jgi:hypothetical protein
MASATKQTMLLLLIISILSVSASSIGIFGQREDEIMLIWLLRLLIYGWLAKSSSPG